MAASNSPTDFSAIADRALARARRWADESTKYPIDPAAKLLADVLDDEGGLDYTVSFVDGVVRPEDQEVAANHLAEIGARNPKFLPWDLRAPALVGGTAGKLLEDGPEVLDQPVRVTYQCAVLLTVPPATEDGKVSAIGAERSLQSVVRVEE